MLGEGSSITMSLSCNRAVAALRKFHGISRISHPIGAVENQWAFKGGKCWVIDEQDKGLRASVSRQFPHSGLRTPFFSFFFCTAGISQSGIIMLIGQAIYTGDARIQKNPLFLMTRHSRGWGFHGYWPDYP